VGEDRAVSSKAKFMSQTSLNIVFGESAAGTLRQAMARSGWLEDVISFPDDLSFGPINPPDPAKRTIWAKQELSYSREHETLTTDLEKFWIRALSMPGRRIIWASKRSARDHAGLLECIWRFEDTNCDLIDLTELKLEHMPVFTLGELNPKQISEMVLWTRAAEISPAAWQQYREDWRKLRDETAPFRVVKNLQLLSAPITVYDDLLVSHMSHRWVKCAEVIGNALAAAGSQLSDAVLFARLRRLTEDGRLEARGDLATMRSEIRLAPQ